MLPLLLTTSHHNLLDAPTSPDQEIGVDKGIDKQAAREKGLPTVRDFYFENVFPHEGGFTFERSVCANLYCLFQGFCSELILWRVDAVGPLSKSGGVSELARINSPEISAFSNVAWIPTLLPR